MDPHNLHQRFTGATAARYASLYGGVGAGNGLKGNKFVWFRFAPGKPCIAAGFKSSYRYARPSAFPSAPSIWIKVAKIPLMPPDRCHPLKNSVGQKGREQREAHNKALHMPNVDLCQVAVIKQILRLLPGWQRTCKGWAFQHFLLTRGAICFGRWGGKKLQHPERFCTDNVRTFIMRHDASE